MKKLLYTVMFLLIVFIGTSHATTYFVKNGGDDAKSGLDDANAWETIGKLNGINFANNDIIQLKRGSTFTDATLTLNSTSVSRSGITVQDYDAGDKPRINGNSVEPIYINHALVNLTLKNIDISGSDTDEHRCWIVDVDGLTIDGIDYNGATGSSTYYRTNAIAITNVLGDIEVKNCTIQNVMKDTFANSQSAWGSEDANGLSFWYGGSDGANVKTSGTVSVHDNTIHDIYADCIAAAGFQGATVDIYDNTLYRFGENGIDMKHSRDIDFYNNVVYHDDYGETDYYGPGSVAAGLSAYFGSYVAQGNIVRENYIHTSKYIGIALPGKDAIIKHNYIKNCGMGILVNNTGARIFGNIFELTTGKPTVEPQASRWVGTMLSGIRVMESVSSALIYNNTFYVTSADHLYGIGYYTGSNVSGVEIKNNIIQMTRDSSSVYPIFVQNATGDYPTVMYNDLYGAHSNRVNWKGTVYDSTEQADWISAGHTGALFTDPEMTNPAGSDFTLDNDSNPCIDIGATLNALYDDALNPATTWSPISVVTSDQDDFSPWDIGAYIFAGVPVPVITDTTNAAPSCPYGADPINVTFSFTTGAVNSYGRISTTNQTWDQMTSAKAMDTGEGATTHSHVVSLACGQTISYYVAASPEAGDNGAESATTGIEVVIEAEQGINPPLAVTNLGSGSLGITNLGSGSLTVTIH